LIAWLTITPSMMKPTSSVHQNIPHARRGEPAVWGVGCGVGVGVRVRIRIGVGVGVGIRVRVGVGVGVSVVSVRVSVSPRTVPLR
jgi:hypothetical protein